MSSALGALGHKTIYTIGGEVEYCPLVWEHGAQPIAAFARSALLDDAGQPLEYWIELKGRKVQLSADDELMDCEIESYPNLFDASARANQLERHHIANPPLIKPPASRSSQ